MCRLQGKRKIDVYLSPKQFDEEVATPHFPALGAELNVFTQEHMKSFKVEGPFEGPNKHY